VVDKNNETSVVVSKFVMIGVCYSVTIKYTEEACGSVNSTTM